MERKREREREIDRERERERERDREATPRFAPQPGSPPEWSRVCGGGARAEKEE